MHGADVTEDAGRADADWLAESGCWGSSPPAASAITGIGVDASDWWLEPS